MLRNEIMGTGYWEREMDIKSFMPIAFQNTLFQKSLKRFQENSNYVST